MRRGALLLVLIGGSGCERPSGHSPGQQEQKTAAITDAEFQKRQEEYLRKLDAELIRLKSEIAEAERIKNLPPFENALEPAGTRRISRACVVEKLGFWKGAMLVENLAGRAPSDVDQYVPADQPPGGYVVGSLAPIGGYSIDRSDGEERFCLRLTEDRVFLDGEGVSKRLTLAEVRDRLKSRGADETGESR